MSVVGNDSKTMILSATDIVELIGQTVSLKRRGKNYIGLCPFHSEKTPSFNVDPAKQFFYCFGCKAAGNAIDFVIKRDRLEFKEALQYLAQRAGIDLPRFGASKEKSSERQLLLEANSAACALFEKWLSDSVTGKPAREYLESRGFNAESIRKFQIGYTPNSWDALLIHPTMKKFAPGLLHQAGLIKARDEGNGHYDTFRDRLMFPIRDEAGRVIAFGGRVMPGSDSPAKYLNSPETPLFSKSRTVYGLDVARQKIVETRLVAVVEGYTDVVMAHQYGATNVVSILGTAMTEGHVAILRRFADRIVLLFDADVAGDLAVDRAVELFLTQPIEIAIASIPEDLDPDEYLLKHGLDAFNALLNGAQDALTYKWKQLSRRFEASGDLTARQKALEEYLQALAAAKGSGPVDALRWGSALARVSRLTDIPVETLNRRFRVSKHAPRRPTNMESDAPVVDAPVSKRFLTDQDRAEQWILGILLQEPSRWSYVQQHLLVEEFTDDLHRRLAEIYWQHQRDEGEPEMPGFLDMLPEPDLKELAVRLVQEVEHLSELDRTLADSLAHFRASRERENLVKLPGAILRTRESGGPVETEIDLLRQAAAKASQPDLKRVK